jgi:rod shape-determining protein MreD
MDDIFSGQPFGSAGLLWSLAMLTIEIIDSRAIWRDYIQDWLIAALLIRRFCWADCGLRDGACRG